MFSQDLFLIGLIQDIIHILDLMLDLTIAIFEFGVEVIAWILGFCRAFLNLFTGG